MISFKPLWDTLKEKGISQKDLERLGYSRSQINKLHHETGFTLYTIQVLCNLLNVSSDKIVKVTPDINSVRIIKNKKTKKKK